VRVGCCLSRCSCRSCSFSFSLAVPLLGMRLRGRYALFPPRGEQKEEREKRVAQRHLRRRVAPALARTRHNGIVPKLEGLDHI
jgi:hypothetical protein